MRGLKEKRVLITGGASGIGAATAARFLEEGAQVCILDRDAKASESLRNQLPQISEAIIADVTDLKQVEAAFAQAVHTMGAIDVLINNAGLGYLAVVEELRLEDFRRQFEVNLFGAVRVTQAVLPHMRARRNGRILMMSSVAGLVSPPTYGAYSSSKHALEGLSNSLRLEMYPFGVDVILIEPGYIITNFQQIARELAQPYSKMAKTSPYARIYASAAAGSDRGRARSKTTPEDCAQVILQAIESPHPKARYPVTPMAKWASFGKRILPDTLFDSILRKRFGITREN